MAAALLEMVRDGKKKGMDQLAEIMAPYVRTSKQGACFAWGSGSNFQLGETCSFVSKNKALPRQVSELPADLCAVVTSKLHSAVISTSGTVWASGWTSGPDERKARGSKVRLGFHPVGGLDRLRVTSLALSDKHTLAVVDSGGVYAWGSNKHGQLGLSLTGNKEATVQFEGLPRRLMEIKSVRISSAAAAAQHSVLVQAEGCVWTFGSNKNGQLGHSVRMPQVHMYLPCKKALHQCCVFVLICDKRILPSVAGRLLSRASSRRKPARATGSGRLCC